MFPRSLPCQLEEGPAEALQQHPAAFHDGRACRELTIPERSRPSMVEDVYSRNVRYCRDLSCLLPMLIEHIHGSRLDTGLQWGLSLHHSHYNNFDYYYRDI